jgi:hypothetical protein
LIDFVIVAPVLTRRSAGSVVLHQLAVSIVRAGFSARILFYENGQFFTSKNPSHYMDFDSTAFQSKDNLSKELFEKAIVVYPEIIPNNPLNATYVVRYFLFHDGIHSGKKVLLGESDFIVTYVPSFYQSAHFNLFYPIMPSKADYEDVTKFPLRTFDSTYVDNRKYVLEKNPFSLVGTTQVTKTFPETQERLYDLLKRCRIFYTWNVDSSTVLDAIVLGAVPALIDTGNRSDLMSLSELKTLGTVDIGDTESVFYPFGLASVQDGLVRELYIPPNFTQARGDLLSQLEKAIETWGSKVLNFCQSVRRHFSIAD